MPFRTDSIFGLLTDRKERKSVGIRHFNVCLRRWFAFSNRTWDGFCHILVNVVGHSLDFSNVILKWLIEIARLCAFAFNYLSGLMDVFPPLVVARKPPRWNGLWVKLSLSSRKFPELVRMILNGRDSSSACSFWYLEYHTFLPSENIFQPFGTRWFRFIKIRCRWFFVNGIFLTRPIRNIATLVI